MFSSKLPISRLVGSSPCTFSLISGFNPIKYRHLHQSVAASSKVNSSNQFLRRTPTLKKSNKKKVPENDSLLPVTIFTTCEQFDLAKARVAAEKYCDSDLLIPDEVLHAKIPLVGVSSKLDVFDVMVLSNGTIVTWGLDEQTVEKEVVPIFKDAEQNSYGVESEEMDYVEYPADLGANSELTSFMDGEVMVITGPSEEKKLLDKAAFAAGLSRSTRLAVLETALEAHIELTRENSVNLSLGKKLNTTESEVLKLTGRLFLLRGKLNLYSELIETPDLYWSEPNLEKIYDAISKQLDIHPRISILNRKLDYATEEQRALLAVLNEKKGTRLEWIIIYLIMVEVCFETFHFYERFFEKNETVTTS